MPGFNEALLSLQQAMPALQKDAINPHFVNKYITLGSLLDKILPVLHENGWILVQQVTQLEGKPALETILTHVESGNNINGKMLLMLDKENPQGQGSAITYARRYALMTVLNLTADEDDDGESASPARRSRPSPKVVKAESNLSENVLNNL
jgi:hypothetical protein